MEAITKQINRKEIENKNEQVDEGSFQWFSTITVILLFLTFMGASLYILITSAA